MLRSTVLQYPRSFITALHLLWPRQNITVAAMAVNEIDSILFSLLNSHFISVSEVMMKWNDRRSVHKILSRTIVSCTISRLFAPLPRNAVGATERILPLKVNLVWR